jgi:Tol biopolymer transport system component
MTTGLIRTLTAGTVVAAALVLGSMGVGAAQSGQELFQQALSKERGEGALQDAIALYQRVVQEAAGDRALEARALLQIAGIYERLDNPEARSTYERIVRDFSDNAQAVATARARLAAMSKAGSAENHKNVASTVRDVSFNLSGRVSPDGHWFVIGGGPNQRARPLQPYRSLYARNVDTGEIRPLDTAAPAVERMQAFVWSADSRRVAYNKCYAPKPPTRPTQVCELRVASLDGGTPRVVYPQAPGFLQPLAWSPDGQFVATRLYGLPAAGQNTIGLVSLPDASVRALKVSSEGPETLSDGMAFSPDGRYLVYNEGGWNAPRDIMLLAVDGSGDTALIRHPADDRFVAWTPAGDLLFRSDRSGTVDLLLAHVVDGHVQGLPLVVKRDMGLFDEHGMSSDGALYYLSPGGQEMSPIGAVSFQPPENDIQIAVLDPATGRVVEAPRPIAERAPGRGHAPTWSADGTSLIYRTSPIWSIGWNELVMLSMKTGEERRIRPQGLSNLGQDVTMVMPDGKSFVVVTATDDGRRLYKVDAETGAVTGPIGGNIGGSPRLLPDGRTVVAFRPGEPDDGRMAVIARDLASGEDTVVYAAPQGAQLRGLAVSPDGRSLALIESSTGQSHLFITTIKGGQTREVISLPTTILGGSKNVWSPDGRFIYFVEGDDPNSGPQDLWRVSSGGGQPAKVLTFGTEIWDPAIDKTGRYLAFASLRRSDAMTEHVLEHFLPDGELRPATAAAR